MDSGEKAVSSGVALSLVLAPTDAGRAELTQPAAGLSLPQRKLLSKVDGRQSLADLVGTDKALTEERIARDALRLLNLGLARANDSPDTQPAQPDTAYSEPVTLLAEPPAAAPREPATRVPLPALASTALPISTVAAPATPVPSLAPAVAAPVTPVPSVAPAVAAPPALVPARPALPAHPPSPARERWRSDGQTGPYARSRRRRTRARGAVMLLVSAAAAAVLMRYPAPDPAAESPAAKARPGEAAIWEAPVPSARFAESPGGRQPAATGAEQPGQAAFGPLFSVDATGSRSAPFAGSGDSLRRDSVEDWSIAARAAAVSRPSSEIGVGENRPSGPVGPVAAAPKTAVNVTTAVETPAAAARRPEADSRESSRQDPDGSRAESEPERLARQAMGRGLMHQTQPIFPLDAIRQGVTEGSVRVRVFIAADGTVERVETSVLDSRHAVFEASAREAVLTWTYVPGAPGRVHDTVLQFRAFERASRPAPP